MNPQRIVITTCGTCFAKCIGAGNPSHASWCSRNAGSTNRTEEYVLDPNPDPHPPSDPYPPFEDWPHREALVDRAGNALADYCQDRYGFRLALGQRDTLAEVALRAAFGEAA